jgi:hypothetical protein
MPSFKVSPRARTASELVIQRLYDITSDYDAGFSEQVKSLLRMGCERFRLDIGIVSAIVGDHYEVVAPEEVGIAVGDVFSLKNTYCSLTLDASGPFGFEHSRYSELAGTPGLPDVGQDAG